MARFLAAIQGSRGEATRLGTPNSGIRAQAQGWDVGVKVHGDVDENDTDVFQIYATHGSHAHGSSRYLGKIYKGTDGELYFERSENLAAVMLR
jgi:hypothetical protein